MDLELPTRKVTVIYEGIDDRGEGFMFERQIDATKGGDNPRFFGEQAADVIRRAADSIQESVEATYGRAPVKN